MSVAVLHIGILARDPATVRWWLSERSESSQLVDGRRGAGRKLTDDELRGYIEVVKREHPYAHVIDEQEYAYWIEGIALSGKRFGRLWHDVTTGVPEQTDGADDKTIAGQP